MDRGINIRLIVDFLSETMQIKAVAQHLKSTERKTVRWNSIQ